MGEVIKCFGIKYLLLGDRLHGKRKLDKSYWVITTNDFIAHSVWMSIELESNDSPKYNQELTIISHLQTFTCHYDFLSKWGDKWHSDLKAQNYKWQKFLNVKGIYYHSKIYQHWINLAASWWPGPVMKYVSPTIECIIMSCFKDLEEWEKGEKINITMHCLNNGCISKNYVGNKE